MDQREELTMSESKPEAGDTNVEADQVVVNNAPDGGGVDQGGSDAPAETEDDSKE